MGLYNELCFEAQARKDKKDCAVRALCVATGQPYGVVYDYFKSLGRRDGYGTPFDMINRAISKYDLNTMEVTVAVRKQAKTVKTFQRVCNPIGIFLIYTSGHILCIKHGVVEDWTNNRACHIQKVIQIAGSEVQYLNFPSPFKRSTSHKIKDRSNVR